MVINEISRNGYISINFSNKNMTEEKNKITSFKGMVMP